MYFFIVVSLFMLLAALFHLKPKVHNVATISAAFALFLMNSTIFATFTFLVSVLLCHNLDSSMLKSEGSLT